MTDEVGRTVILGLVPTSIRLLMNVDKDAEAQSVLLGELKLKRRVPRSRISSSGTSATAPGRDGRRLGCRSRSPRLV